MKDFKQLLQEGRIEEVTVDKAKSRGLIKRSNARLQNQKDRNINENNAFEVLENLYEALREIIESGMAVDGYKSKDHVSTIAYGKTHLDLTRKETNKLHKFRKLRNNSRYEAEKITKKEAKQILQFSNKFIPKIQSKIEEKQH